MSKYKRMNKYTCSKGRKTPNINNKHRTIRENKRILYMQQKTPSIIAGNLISKEKPTEFRR
jgi:hypothetical protein